MSIKGDEYLNTVNRMEPDVTAVDTGPALASIAISLKRIADALEGKTGLYEGIGNAILHTPLRR